MSAHKRNDADIVEFVSSLNPQRRTTRRGQRRRGVPPPPAPRRWTVPLIAIVGALFATSGGIALAASNSEDPPEVNCTLQVPANPLSAQGLATPYRLLTSSCHQADSDTSAFVQAAVIDPATGAISVYSPVVVDGDDAPAAPPVVPKLPAGAVVGIWFGFNGDNLTLADDGGSLTAGSCVNGLDDSIFGQYAYCNAPAFFTAANAAIAAGKTTVPPLGTAKDGLPCPTTRDFGIVDMDQSDNVTTSYLFMPDGSIAQNTAANQAALASKGAKVETNGSDNGLLDSFVSPTLGCTPYLAPDLTDPGKSVPALPLNELQAAAFQPAPVALVPTSDPMVLVDGKTSVRKTNLYRAGVNMGPVDTATETPKAYCQNLVVTGIDRTNRDRDLTVKVASPDAGAANSLFTFLAQRLSESFGELGCGELLGIRDPVTVTTNDDGVAVNARLTPVTLPSPSPTAAPTGSTRPSQTPSAPASTGPTASRTPTGAPTKAPTTAPTKAPTVAPTTAPTRAPTVAPTHAPTKAPTHAPTTPARPASTTAARPPTHAATTGGGGGGRSTSGGGGNPAPAVVPAGNTNTLPPAGGLVASAAPPDVASPLPTLTLGPMPLKTRAARMAGGSTGVGSMPPARLAGTVLLSGGGILVIGILIRGLVNRRRRREYQFSEF